MNDSANSLIAEAQADFAIKLLRDVSKGESTILSPISVAIALSMVYAGAKDETAEEMNKMLANGAPDSKVHQYFGELVQYIQNGKKNYTLEVANKVYVKSGFSILDTYKKAIDSHYGGLFESVEFTKAQETAKKINDFVAHATHDKIQNLISPSSLDDMTRLVLINAIYFKGNWASKFSASLTQKKPFYTDANNHKELDMMHKTHKFVYQETPEFQVLGMPYVGEDVFMFVLLPKQRFGLRQALASLTGKALMEMVAKRGTQEVQVVLPKFKLESTHQLNEPLATLGLRRAFSDDAQFNGIATAPLKISEVIQKAFIEVNEEGTEAAAATAVMMVAKSAPMPKQPPPKFEADHPFAFVLLGGGDQQQQNLLFNGIFLG